YATLSHCWGTVRPMTTTMSTLSDRMQSIPLNLLPKTFQDTVLLTRKFRLKYLWIDSLCIIQDSKDDWEVESAKMGQIYRGSAITIAATSATDSRDRCFVEKQNWIESVPFETLDVDGLPATVYVQSVSQASHDISHNRLFEDEPLSRRGWVLQERLLSTRVLLYTASELVFECQTDLASIWSMTLLRDSSPSFLSILFNLALQYATNNRLLDRPKIFQYWRHIITIYTQRCLTFDRDILPALSGLASLIQPLVLDAYLAGLWREDFHRQLLWCKACSHIRLTADDHALLKSLPRTTELCPPTWSWASVRGAVSYDGMWTSEGKLEGLAKVLAVHCDLNSRDP
ncbi:heterokaryon incompatibility protein-domain-containing protein, partial [Leptodontidium sp. 2 PMI_412]